MSDNGLCYMFYLSLFKCEKFVELPQHGIIQELFIVRQLNNKFGVDADVPDKSVKFFPHAPNCLRFLFFVGTTSADDVMVPISQF